MNWDYEIVFFFKKKSKIIKSIGIFPCKTFLKMQGPVIILALLVEKHVLLDNYCQLVYSHEMQGKWYIACLKQKSG